MKSKSIVLVLMAAILTSAPTGVRAYSYSTHSRIVERAVDAMQLLADGDSNIHPSRPSGVGQADFDAYLNAIMPAPAKLKSLSTGLPKALQGQVGWTPWWDNPDDEPYPFNNSASGAPACFQHPEDDLSDLSKFRISEFRYFPKETAEPCGLRGTDDPNDVPNGQTAVLGKVLGWHAATVDDHVDDTVIWHKPTNALAKSELKKILTDASTALLVTLIAVPACLIAIFSGHGCNPHDVYALADQLNPVVQLEGLIPGFGTTRSTLYTGLWHFINVARTGDGFYNRIPGMKYMYAGPSGDPGEADMLVVISTDLAGLSLNAWAANGNDYYGRYDEFGRSTPSWMTHSIGHVEFSPLDNLAQYGWDKFKSSGRQSVEGLGWPLHAIGDASEPHHVVGTTSWGHVPYEHSVEHDIKAFFPTTDPERYAQLNLVIAEGYRWWKLLQGIGDRDIRPFIEELARETRARVQARGDWAYNDLASHDDLYGNMKDGEQRYWDAPSPSGVGHTNLRGFQELLELSSGATLAFLTHASEGAVPLGYVQHDCDTPPKGAPGDAFSISQNSCQSTNPTDPSCLSCANCPPGPEFVCSNACCLYVPQ